MDARRWAPWGPSPFDAEIRRVAHDLGRAKVDLATGRLDASRYARVAPALAARLRSLETQRLATMMQTARRGAVAWQHDQGG